MNDVISILGRRLDVSEPGSPPPDPDPDPDEPTGSGREPPDGLPVLVAI